MYFLTNRHQTVLYVGVTSDLRKRLAEHLAGVHPSSFTFKYNVDRLVYFELTADIRAAIAREKQIKRWSRWKKVAPSRPRIGRGSGSGRGPYPLDPSP